MGESAQGDAAESAGLARRQFLLKAAITGTAAFAIPAMITVEPAGAAGLTSPPPHNDPPKVESGTVEVDTALAPGYPGAVGASQLAFTGAEPDDLFRAGLAATAGGAALLYWNAKTATEADELPPGSPGS